MKRPTFARLALFLLVILCAVACNWIYRYEEVYRSGNKVIADYRGQITEVERYLGGWPSKYYVCCSYSNDLQFSSWSYTRLLGNVAVWTAILLAVVGYELHAQSRQVADSKAGRRKLSIVDLLVATFLVAMVLFYIQTLRSRTAAHRELAQRLATTGGNAIQTTYLPAPFGKWMPGYVKGMFSRLSDVSLVSPSDEQLQEILQLTQLSQLRIGGGDYDLRLLDSIAEKPFLREIRISGRPIDAELISAIGSAKQLQAINLMRTSATAELLLGLGTMPALRDMNLIHTDVKLTQTEPPVWSSNVRILALPRPPQGMQAELRIQGWPKLEELTCSEYDEYRNTEVMAVQLSDLPELTELWLDALQLFDLELDGLPKLKKVSQLHWQVEQRTPPTQEVPSFPWVRKLTVSNVPQLEELPVYGTHIQQISLDAEDALFGVCVMPHSMPGRPARYGYYGFFDTSDTTIPLPTRQAWIDGLADSVGPRVLDYSHVPLQSVDLQPLAKNTGIRSLDLSHSSVEPRQLEPIKAMEQLEEINVLGCQVDGETIADLVETLPNLRRVQCDPAYLSQLKLVGNSRLESVVGESRWNYSSLGALHLENLPNLSDVFQLAQHASQIYVKDMPALQGVVFNAPLPQRCILSGLRDLKVFAGGGARLDDELAQELLRCTELQKLTMAHCPISNDILRALSDLKELRYLCLTGTAISDDVVNAWQPLEQLVALRLDQTEVSSGAMPYITKLKRLERLWIDDLSEAAFQDLAQLGQLKQLSIHGAQLSVLSMGEIVKLNQLQELDISECELSPEVASILIQKIPSSLEILRLRNAKLDGPSLMSLARLPQRLTFDLENLETDPKITDAIVAAGRAVETYGDPRIPRFATFMSGSPDEDDSDERVGEVAPELFDPAYVESFEQYAAPLPSGNTPQVIGPNIFSFEALGYWLGRMIAGPPKPIETF